MASCVNGPSVAVIGGSGFLGSKLIDALSAWCDVIGTYHSQRRQGLLPLSIANSVATHHFFDKHNPDITIHCGGITRPDACQLNPELACAVNVEGARNIVESTGSKVIYISTDYVFDGEVGSYSEDGAPNPINVYGMTKLEAEQLVLNASKNNVVLRTASLYGFNAANNAFLESLQTIRPAQRVVDLICSPTFLDDVVQHVPYFFDKAGVYHLVGPGRASRYDFLRMTIELLSMDVEVEPVRADQLDLLTPRPRDTSLTTRRHSLKMRSLEEGLALVREQLSTS